MEDSGDGDDFLVWSQKGHILAAVNRYNVVSFWNTLTGKLIQMKVLEGDAKIEDAHKYRCYEYQARYQDPANLFESHS